MSNSISPSALTVDPHTADRFRLLVNAVLDQALCIVDLAWPDRELEFWSGTALRLPRGRDRWAALSDACGCAAARASRWHELRRLTLATERYEFEYAGAARKMRRRFSPSSPVSLLKNGQGQAVSFAFVARCEERTGRRRGALGAEVRERASPDTTAEIARAVAKSSTERCSSRPIGILYADDKESISTRTRL